MNQIKRFTVAVMVACVAACASSATEQHEYDDPFEGYNRAMFSFNYQVDKYVIKPVAEGYRAVTTPFIRERISSVIDNLKEPVSAGNYLLQADPEASVKSLSRFVINSTLGLVGMFDVAEGWGLPKDKTTFNETFAKWCIPQGPFIVLPLLGPSTPRAATGMALDFVFDPVYWATYQDANVHDKASWGYAIAQGITVREAALDILDDLERNSVDFYATMRSAYLQNQNKLKCFNDVSKDENTYDFDFGIEDEDAAFDEMEAE
ncbi:MAG: VacJ family lipoprotein [Proteobacteria bacterium]|nr:VacJ family lipoprotein [Pseudomonadota bacterium]